MALVKTTGLSVRVRKALSCNWQTSSVIASQIDFPPDAVARRKGKRSWGNSEAAAKADLAAQSLSHIFKRDKGRSIERRLISAGKYEYRLIPIEIEAHS